MFKGNATFIGTRIEGFAYFDFDWQVKSFVTVDDETYENPGSIFKSTCDFNGIEVSRAAFFDRTRFSSQANFGAIKVGGQLSFMGAFFSSGAAFDESEVFGKALFHGAYFAGEEVSFAGTQCRAGAYFQPCIALREYFYQGTVFEGHVIFNAASFGPEFNFEGEIAHYMSLLSDIPEGAADRGIGERFFGDVDLRGCKYQRIKISSWKALMSKTNYFEPQPYVELEKAFRASGEEQLADEVYFERRCLEGKRKKGIDKVVDLLLWALVGYGAKLSWLVGWIFMLLALGTVAFRQEGAVRISSSIESNNMSSLVRCSRADACQLSWLDSFWMTLDTLLPLPVSLPVSNLWEPSSGTALGFLSYAGIASILSIVGWIIVPVSIAGLTGLLKRPSIGA